VHGGLFDLLGSLLGLPTKFGGSRNGSEIQRGPRIVAINHLKWGELSGLAWCPIEGKLRMGKELIPPCHTFLEKYPKQGTKTPVSDFGLAVGLGMESGAKLEVSPHLPL